MLYFIFDVFVYYILDIFDILLIFRILYFIFGFGIHTNFDFGVDVGIDVNGYFATHLIQF